MALNFKTGNGIYEDRSHSDFNGKMLQIEDGVKTVIFGHAKNCTAHTLSFKASPRRRGSS